MNSDLSDVTVAGFLDSIAERTPAPGGGGACAVAIGMAAALVAMAARFSTKQLPDADDIARRADALRAEALPLVAADAAAYSALLTAFRDTSEARDELVTEASGAACEVPLRMTDLAARTAGLAATVGTSGNPNLRGDACTAALLCRSAASAAATLVGINVAAGGLDDRLVENARADAAAASKAAATLEDAS
ncbi:MAG: formiminotransferase-cyclodeaminase [Streptosporangiales bacterium]|nr:formiminotransferase-cyclodeaminase [Streptosporangiales bacterium]